MALNTVTFILDGDVPLEEFAKGINGFTQLVKALSDEAGTPLDWILEDLQVSSATATAKAIGNEESAETVVRAYVDVGTALQSHSPITHSGSVKRAVQKMVSIKDARIKSVRFESALREAIVQIPVTVRMARAIPIQLPPSTALSTAIDVVPAFGGILGRVQTLSNRGSLRFTLFDVLNDKAVSCYIEEGKEDILRNIWGKMAIVEGMITRDPITGRPLAIRKVRNITEQPEPYPKGEYQQARGVSPSDGLAPEEVIRRIRDAQ